MPAHRWALACLLALAALQVAAAQRQVVIFDTDVDHEDLFGMLFLARSPLVDMRLVVIHGGGFGEVTWGVDHASKLLSHVGMTHVRVCAGPEKALTALGVANKEKIPKLWLAGLRNMFGLMDELPPGKARACPTGGVEAMAALIKSSKTRVKIVSTGGLTAIAELFRRHPELRTAVDVVAMGGAVYHPGNLNVGDFQSVPDNRVAEWNVFLDPVAAREVLQDATAAGARVLLVPLDATRDVPMTPAFHRRLGAIASGGGMPGTSASPHAVFLHRLMSAFRGVEGRDFENLYFWDTLTCVAAVKPTVVAARTVRLRVDVSDGPASGQTAEDRDGTFGGGPLQVAVAADTPFFEEEFFTTLGPFTARTPALDVDLDSHGAEYAAAGLSAGVDAAEEELLRAAAAAAADADEATQGAQAAQGEAAPAA
eukprot:tig00000889_g5333.t1